MSKLDEEQSFKWLNGLSGFREDRYGLEGVRQLLESLGRPDKDLRFIHIAGTNGKGSVARFCSEALVEAGIKTGLFISPHVIKFNERIQVNGNFIKNFELVELINLVKPIVENLAMKKVFCSQFDVVTVVALEYFRRSFCKYVVLEVGMGGRLDSTNAILASSVVLTIITKIGFDHVKELGPSLREIAYEKAGIVKSGCVCVCSRFEPDKVFEVLNEVCKTKGSKLVKSYEAKDVTCGFGFNSFWFKGQFFKTKLSGPFQVENAMIAITALSVLNFVRGTVVVKIRHIQKAFLRACWPARFEFFYGQPAVILDGAHNVDGVKVLLKALELCEFKFKVGVFSILKTKNYADVLSEVKKIGFSKLILTQMDFENAAEVFELEAVSNSLRLSFISEKSSFNALAIAKDLAGKAGLVVVFGSLYFVSQVRRYLI